MAASSVELLLLWTAAVELQLVVKPAAAAAAAAAEGTGLSG